MTDNKLCDLMKSLMHSDHATESGRAMHRRMQTIRLHDENTGNQELIQQIKNRPELIVFFEKNSKTEVPIAGYINGRFVSRRIDRLCIDDNAKTIRVLDYKTDLNPDNMRDKYISQIHEYVTLMRAAFPQYLVTGYILWLHNWQLEKIV